MRRCGPHLRRWFPRLALLGLIVMVARGVSWPELWSHMSAASLPMVCLALVSNCLACAARTALWWRLLRAIGIRSLALAIRAMLVGMALNCVVVGNAGEAGRVLLVMRRTGASAAAVTATVVLERLAVTTGYVAVLVVAGIFVPLPEDLARWRVPGMVMLCTGVLVLLRLAREPRVGRLHAGNSRLGAVRHGIQIFRSSVRQAAAGSRGSLIVGLTGINWICQLVTFHWTAKALGLPISVGGSVIAMLAVTASGSVRATPGNAGVTQLAYVAIAEMLGLSVQAALGVALLLQAIQTAPIAMGALFVLSDLTAALPSGAHGPPLSASSKARA
ncbi:MAG TPA: lysylphosphatidylglycerol synthase transmembrane domain-containing protein [Gemmatimonadaceae bacterium]|nr:lysylphosphatidylglycerol synthase transmembrane domain-containing protein [Gemmatimonadaceae bacterium]